MIALNPATATEDAIRAVLFDVVRGPERRRARTNQIRKIKPPTISTRRMKRESAGMEAVSTRSCATRKKTTNALTSGKRCPSVKPRNNTTVGIKGRNARKNQAPGGGVVEDQARGNYRKQRC